MKMFFLILVLSTQKCYSIFLKKDFFRKLFSEFEYVQNLQSLPHKNMLISGTEDYFKNP